MNPPEFVVTKNCIGLLYSSMPNVTLLGAGAGYGATEQKL